MNIEEIRAIALAKEAVTESFPFGEDTLVFKVQQKIFMLMSLDDIPPSINLKCPPERALELREEFPEHVLPGYHMNKKHWNTIILDGTLKRNLIVEMIADSYRLVYKKGK